MKVGSYRTPKHANDDTLLILSMGLSYWMIPVDDRYELRVESEVAEDVMVQLQRSRTENRFWPPIRFRNTNSDVSEIGAHVNAWSLAPYFMLMFIVFIAQSQWGASFTNTGRLDVQAVWIGHEWWRVITALTLHADLPHLLGNLGMGGFFSLLVMQSFGTRLGWGLIFLGGILGNTANVWIHSGEAYYAIGASTAVFAAVGILAGRALRVRVMDRNVFQRRELMAPVFVALVVLAWWGSSGENTDIMGHLMGLLAGILMGFVFQWRGWVGQVWVPRLMVTLTVAGLLFAWLFATR